MREGGREESKRRYRTGRENNINADSAAAGRATLTFLEKLEERGLAGGK